MTDTEVAQSRWQQRERHPRRLTASTVPCRAHRGRVTPKRTVHKPTSHRYHGSKTSHVHLPRRDCPVNFGDDQKWRACSCGQLKTGCTDAEVAAWWDRHRRGLSDAELPEETKPRKVLRSWRGKLTSLRTAAAQATVTIRTTLADSSTVQKPSISGIKCRIASASSSVRFALDALRCLRPHGHVEVANSTNQFGRRCLDPAKGFALRGNARTVAFENRAGERIELIRTRRTGQAGWVAVTGDKFDGRFFPTVSGGAGVDLFFRAAGTTWASTTSWSTTSGGGSAGVTPAATDRAIFEAASAACSIGATALCRSLDCTAGTGNYASTISGANNITLGDATAPTGNVQLKIRGTWTQSGIVTFANTGNATNTVDANGATIGGQVAFAHANGTIQLVTGDLTAGANITKTAAGTLDTNGRAVTSTTLMNFLTGTVTCGASVFTCHGAGLTVTPATLNAGTSEFKMDLAGTVTFTGTGLSFYKVTYDVSASASKTNVLSIAGDFTWTNTFKVGGNAVAGNNANRPLVQSSTLGTARTLTGTGGTFTMTGDVDFSDITVSGAPTFSNASSCFVGDCQGNGTYLTCTSDGGTNGTARTTQTSTGTASYTWSTHGWTSRVPLPQDDVSIPNAFVAGRTITADMPRLGRSITCTCTGSPTFDFNTLAVAVFGSFTLAAGVSPSGTNGITLSGRSAYTITSAGSTWTGSLVCNCVTGTYTLQDALVDSRTATAISVQSGTFDDGGRSVSISGAAGGIVAVSGGTLTMTGGWSFAVTSVSTFFNRTGTGTVNGTGSTITLTGATTNTRTFAGGGQTYGTLTYTVANSPGILSITGSNTWAGTWNIGPGRIGQCPSGGTQTFTAANGLGGVAGANQTLYAPGASGNYASAPDSAAVSITGNITLDGKFALNNWNPSAGDVTFVAKEGSSSTRSYRLGMTAGGTAKLNFLVSNDGTAFDLATCNVGTGFAAGTTNWIRAAADLVNHVVRFYTSSDGSTWVQLGADQVLTKTSIFDGTQIVEIGSSFLGTVNNLGGTVYRARIYNSYLGTGAGTAVFDADFTTKAFGANTFTESSSNAATVTINGALAQAGDGRVTLQAASGTTTLATTGGSTMTYTVPDHILATPSGAVYVLDGVDGGSNTGIVFDPPSQLPQDVTVQGRGFVPRQAVSRAGRW